MKDAREWAVSYLKEFENLDGIRTPEIERLRDPFAGEIVLIVSTETASGAPKATPTPGGLPGVSPPRHV